MSLSTNKTPFSFATVPALSLEKPVGQTDSTATATSAPQASTPTISRSATRLPGFDQSNAYLAMLPNFEVAFNSNEAASTQDKALETKPEPSADKPVTPSTGDKVILETIPADETPTEKLNKPLGPKNMGVFAQKKAEDAQHQADYANKIADQVSQLVKDGTLPQALAPQALLVMYAAAGNNGNTPFRNVPNSKGDTGLLGVPVGKLGLTYEQLNNPDEAIKGILTSPGGVVDHLVKGRSLGQTASDLGIGTSRKDFQSALPLVKAALGDMPETKALDGLIKQDKSLKDGIKFTGEAAKLLPDKMPTKEAGEIATILTDKGFNKNAIAVILGNMATESTLDPRAGTDYKGLIQWNTFAAQPGDRIRYNDLKSWTASRGLDPNSIKGQVLFMIDEMKTRYPSAYSALKNNPDMAQAWRGAEIYVGWGDENGRKGYADQAKNALTALGF